MRIQSKGGGGVAKHGEVIEIKGGGGDTEAGCDMRDGGTTTMVL